MQSAAVAVSPSERDRVEIERSAIEASRITLEPLSLDRYMSPPADALYGLEFAFHLLGDVRGKTVLDLGCGSGQNLVAVANRGANVIGLDISPQLIGLAQQRLNDAGKVADLRVGSAHATQLPDESVDVVFAIAVLHHLDLKVAREEIRRILRKEGRFILSEPIRFSGTLNRLRPLFPARDEVSSFEHPFTRQELSVLTQGFEVTQERTFRLPFVPLLGGTRPGHDPRIWKVDRWLNQHFPKLEHFATTKVMSARKLY
jgi:SAM-dependent methyltransferase